MARAPFQKLKILYIMDYLLRYSDEYHPVTVAQLIEELGKRGISAERKSIYSDIDTLRSLGFSTAAMALTDNSISIEDPVLADAEKLAIVLGSEGNGLCEETIAHCDYTARIPMYHGVDSLNVAAAGAVIFWQLRAREKN